ncbi:MAG: ATP-binding protein [Fibrobacteria bacterium]|nr:ATP-binding protein [Fibrobacteria bacterium]
MKKLPIGIATFSKIRDTDENYAYVDKTDIANHLIENGSYYFLSRPRRFGKSLFLDTLAEIFQGNKELFEGLAVYDKWDWKQKYPVIRISFGSGDFKNEEGIKSKIRSIIINNAEELSLDLDIESPTVRDDIFGTLLKHTYKKYKQKVVVLIDEYDKPVLDNISNKEQALIARDMLKNFYSAIKDSDRYIRFVFITGVSKFSKMNLFSGLNNLEDITLKKDYATITGYTHKNLKDVFGERLKGVDLEKVKKWYNGYNYFGDPIYNPFDILLFLSNDCEFQNYWWGTGNPSFLIEKLKEQNYYLPDLENIKVGQETLDCFDVDKIDIVALLWQTGYLTFDKKLDFAGKIRYKMKVPNLEILNSLNTLFFDYLIDLNGDKGHKETAILESLLENDFEKFKVTLTSLFASIPYNNYTNNLIANYEGYYSSVVFTFLASLGFDVVAEDTTNRGRIDLTIKAPNSTWIIEFKVDSPDSAIKQIKEKRYFEKYQDEGMDIYLVGISFDSESKNISDFVWEQYNDKSQEL